MARISAKSAGLLVDEFDFSSLEVTSCVSFIKKLTPEYRRRWRALTGCTLFETSSA